MHAKGWENLRESCSDVKNITPSLGRYTRDEETFDTCVSCGCDQLGKPVAQRGVIKVTVAVEEVEVAAHDQVSCRLGVHEEAAPSE
jgi:flavoprotein